MSKYNKFLTLYNKLILIEKFKFFLYLFYYWNQYISKKKLFNKKENNLYNYLTEQKVLIYFPVTVKKEYRENYKKFLKLDFNRKINFIIDELIYFEKNKNELKPFIVDNKFELDFFELAKVLLKYFKSNYSN